MRATTIAKSVALGVAMLAALTGALTLWVLDDPTTGIVDEHHTVAPLTPDDLATWEAGVATLEVGEVNGTAELAPGRSVWFCDAQVLTVTSGPLQPGQTITVGCAVVGDRTGASYTLPPAPWEPGTLVDLALRVVDPLGRYQGEPVTTTEALTIAAIRRG